MKKTILLCVTFLLLLTTEIYAQNRIVTGSIIDELSEPVIGANIVEEGTTNGTSSDLKGNFRLVLRGTSDVIVISYIGYKNIRFRVGANRTNLQFKMDPESTELEDVVVVGYGTQKKASVVGAITQVKSEDLQQSSVPNLTNAIAGRVAGVITVMGSGKPGSDDSQIYIRGQATTNSTSPLVLVDGIERDWKQIDPEDIESFSVLKDASATAVYGVRGANGVLLITTKRGKIGKPVLNISTQTAIQQPIRTPKYLNSYWYATLMNEALTNDGNAPEYTEQDLQHYLTGDSPYTHPDNDYYKDFLKKSSIQQLINMNASGGTEFMKYYISANVLYQEGLYKEFSNALYDTNTNYNRYNFRSNLDFDVTKNLSIGIDLTGRLEIRKQPNFGNDLFDKIRRLPPNWQPYINPDGSLGGRSDETRLAPYALISQYGNRSRNKNVLEGVFKLNEKMDYITPGLSFRTMIGYNSSFESRRDIQTKPELWQYNRFGEYSQNRQREDINISTGKGPGFRRISFETALNYARTFNDHDVTGMVLYQQSQDWDQWNIPTGYLGWVGRATYAFKQRYLFEVNAGYNGSMQFAKGHRYGFFPAFSAGWVISEEPFFKEDMMLSYLKLRGSYGEIGNDKIGNFKYLYEQVYNKAPSNQRFVWIFGEKNYTTSYGLIEGMLGNDKVSWERARKSNIGFDSKFLKNRLSFSFDVFHEKRTDILAIPYSIPLVLGFNNPQNSEREDKQGLPPENIGIVINKGFDFEITYNGRIQNFNYFVKGNFTFARNKIERIDEEGKKYDWQKREGKSIGQHFGYTDIGLFKNEDFELDANKQLVLIGGFPVLKEGIPIPTMGVVYPGDCRYEDLNGDGIINSYDIGNIGKSDVPEFNYGLTLGANYKGIDLNILWQGAGGAHTYFNEDAIWEFFAQGKVMEHHLGRYNPNDPSTWDKATYPRLHAVDSENNHQKSTRWLFARDYIRLKNLEIGYTLSKSVLKRINLRKIRVFANGTNLLTFDNVMNWDPESSNSTGSMHPQLRNWNIGLNITF